MLNRDDMMQSQLEVFPGVTDHMAAIPSIEEAFDWIHDKPVDTTSRGKNGGPLSMQLKRVRTLDGKLRSQISAVGDGSIIKLFDKTPFPTNDTDVVCPHFMELKWANGCNFNCAWCYLNGTFRFRPHGKEPYLKDKKKIEKHLREYFDAEKEPRILNSGELSDSLVYEGKGYSLTSSILPIFKSQDKHKLLIVTKSVNINGLLASDSQDHVIVSFSVNAPSVSKQWEKGAPDPLLRIKAASKLADEGYRVRLRLDPMVPIKTWKKDYSDFIEELFSKVEPERITFGSLRGLQSTINFCKDTSWVKYLDESSNWGKKISEEKRKEMYLALIDKIREQSTKCDIAMCKETIKMWEDIGKDYKMIKCNCIW